MQLICVAEVTPECDIRVDEKTKKKLYPGEKIKIKIQTIGLKEEQKRHNAIKRLKKISMKSRLNLYNSEITREDAHERNGLSDL